MLVFFVFFSRTVISHWDLSYGKFRLLSLGTDSCDGVAVPVLQCTLGVLVFPESTELCTWIVGS